MQKINRYYSVMLLVFSILALGHLCVSADTETASRLKKSYNVGGNEIRDYLDKLRGTNPKTYNNLMQFKNSNPGDFESIVLSMVIAGRYEKASKDVKLDSSFDSYSAEYNISKAEVNKYLDELKAKDPGLYQALADLKKNDQKNYNAALLGGIMQARHAGGVSSYVNNFSQVSQIGSEVVQERVRYFAASNEEAKQASVLRMRRLFSKQYDLSLVGIDAQIKNAKDQLDALEKIKAETLSRKEKVIEDALKRTITPLQ